ncbi:MAG: phosphatidylglycerophosphatase A [Actinomycetota bacterium]|nr:phosphatidylglycerophosphatase A [Actinomycetota bacterium]
MKKFIASGFGVGILWEFLFKDKKGGGTLASFLFALLIYFLDLNLLYLFIFFVGLIVIYFIVVDDEEVDDDPSWITLDEICGMSLVTLVSQSDLMPLIAGFIVFRASDILKKPNIVKEMEKYPGKMGILYDDLAAGSLGLVSALVVNQIMFITL